MNKQFFDEIHNEREQVNIAYPNSDYGQGIHEGLRVACIIAKQNANSEKVEAELPASDNPSSPELPEWEEVLDKVTQWWLKYDTDEKASVYNIARKVYNIIACNFGR